MASAVWWANDLGLFDGVPVYLEEWNRCVGPGANQLQRIDVLDEPGRSALEVLHGIVEQYNRGSTERGIRYRVEGVGEAWRIVPLVPEPVSSQRVSIRGQRTLVEAEAAIKEELRKAVGVTFPMPAPFTREDGPNTVSLDGAEAWSGLHEVFAPHRASPTGWIMRILPPGWNPEAVGGMGSFQLLDMSAKSEGIPLEMLIQAHGGRKDH